MRPTTPPTPTTYWLGDGCHNTFVLFDLIQRPDDLSDDFLTTAHHTLLAEHRDDALILLPHNTSHPHLQLRMIVLEPDRSIAAFCGNGARVIAAYLQTVYTSLYTTFSLIAHDGDHQLLLSENGLYGVDMLSTHTIPHASPFIAEAARPLFRQSLPGLWTLPLSYNGHTYDFYYTETGEPHLISLENLSPTTLTALGSHLNTDQRDIFPHGINLNHVRLINSTTIHVTTYERGVNRITPACGTGSTSSAVLCHRLHTVTTPTIQVQTAGGILYIDHDADHNRSILKGPATLCPTPRHVVPPDQATLNPKP